MEDLADQGSVCYGCEFPRDRDEADAPARDL